MTSNNNRIAKNTFLLYGRMLLTMAVSLYTSRVVLNTLGIEDYGIYNVVGGIVAMFSFLNGALVSSTQRYLTFELGKINSSIEQLQRVFSASNYLHVILSFIIIILSETIGLWFFFNKMVIPVERLSAAMWVYQFSVVTMVVQIMSAPLNSVIIAHERMNVFAFISVLEVVLKLLIVYLLLLWSVDKLILYAILVAVVQIAIRLIYSWYCKKHFEEVKVVKINKFLFFEIGRFAGWNIWGGLAATMYGTGLNLLLNLFFGPVVNAARAVAVQVESTITLFASNFMMAVNPQITKLYAQDNLQDMHTLVFRASKFSCFLMLLISLPVLLEADIILEWWLKIVPEHTVSFLRIMLITVIINSMANPLMTSAQATGDVKKYQSIIGGILLLIVPIAYLVLRLGGSPSSVYVVYLTVNAVAFVVRLFMVRPMIKLSLRQFASFVISPCLVVSICSFSLSYFVYSFLPNTVLGVLTTCLGSVLLVALFSLLLGLSVDERRFVFHKIRSYIK